MAAASTLVVALVATGVALGVARAKRAAAIDAYRQSQDALREAIAADDFCYDSISQIRMDACSMDRIGLVGDAAHSTGSHRRFPSYVR
ncbi:hypothetical protein [Agromyces archimandritae]|uniref:Uncharacterized protein n=1 Tax=Agromyces archimandritae TaxID=2781962 RepID=A0A975FM01_9MICO|nr:hypothetical protein [Agromyces archimandritae]QTX04376.1 hypothetical protein G127AT_14050 [Agromyces archimandritae]